MNHIRVGILIALCLFLFPGFCFGNDWSNIKTPAPGPAFAIGSVSSGCIAGAVSLPSDGPGYKIMHLERRRFFGHPKLLKTIEAIGFAVERESLGTLHVGDLAQPCGGPTPSNHLSHQNGLDVDIWFALDPDLTAKADADRSDIPAPSFTNGTGTVLNHSLWKSGNTRVLELAARLPEVERIFVNPHIKKELCQFVPKNERNWLRKIRPWWGHNDHFHMRLACPPGSSECRPQNPLPPGDGCGAPLDWWLHIPNLLPKPNIGSPRDIPIARMPESCKKLLAGKQAR